MKHYIVAALFLASTYTYAQVADTTVCDVLKDPQSFNGKIVRIKGTVVAGFDQFAIQGTGCGKQVNGIWLSYPEGTKGKAGPVAVLELQPAKNFSGTVPAVNRAPVTLDKSKDFKQFDSLLSAQYKGSGMCLGCTKNTVSATLVGRLDTVADAGIQRDGSGKIVGFGGFGNANAYSARLVLQSVSEAAAHEIDYSKSAQASKGEDDTAAQQPGAAPPSGTDDPLATAHKLATAFGAGSPFGDQIERAAAAFGKPHEENGVVIGFGPANEASAKNEGQGSKNSPDGVLYNCTFNSDRLKGDAQARAIVMLGEIVADLRTPPPGGEKASLYELAYHGWTTAAISAIAAGQKTLTLSGGYLLWNAAWSATERDKNLNGAILSFLGDGEQLNR